MTIKEKQNEILKHCSDAEHCKYCSQFDSCVKVLVELADTNYDKDRKDVSDAYERIKNEFSIIQKREFIKDFCEKTASCLHCKLNKYINVNITSRCYKYDDEMIKKMYEELEGEEVGELTVKQMRKKIKEYCNDDDRECNNCPLNGCKYCFSADASDAEIIKNYEKIKDDIKLNKDDVELDMSDKNKIIIYGNDYVELINVLSRNGYSTCMVTKADDCGIPFEDSKHEIVFWRDDNNMDDAMGYQE